MYAGGPYCSDGLWRGMNGGGAIPIPADDPPGREVRAGSAPSRHPPWALRSEVGGVAPPPETGVAAAVPADAGAAVRQSWVRRRPARGAAATLRPWESTEEERLRPRRRNVPTEGAAAEKPSSGGSGGRLRGAVQPEARSRDDAAAAMKVGLSNRVKEAAGRYAAKSNRIDGVDAPTGPDGHDSLPGCGPTLHAV